MRQALMTSLLSEVAELAPCVNLSELERRFTDVMASYHVERTGTEIAVLETFPRAAKDYLSTRLIEGLSKSTLRSYHRLLRRFFEDVRLPLERVDTVVIKTWLYGILNSGVSPRTASTYQAILSAFFTWSTDNEYIQKNPARRVSTIKFEEKRRHALSVEEMESVRNACKSLKERTIVELLYSTGCRIGEFVAIRRSDINLEAGTINAHNWKSRKDKVVYISESCAHYLRRYLDDTDGDALFTHSGFGGQKPMDVRSVERLVSSIGIRAGLPKGRLHPHIFRHTLATRIVSNGGSLSDAQAVLDHKKPETTLIYAELSRTQVQEVHRRCAA